MPYISERGVISGSRPLWRLSTITDLFWDALNVVYLFLRTLIEPGLRPDQMRSNGRRGGGGGGREQGPPRPPKPRFGGFPSSSSCPPGAPPMMGGG